MSKLTPLQTRIVHTLAAIEPPWTLTGGAALVGIYLGHRTTRDLDLFWHGLAELGSLLTLVRDCLTASGLDASTLERSLSFAQLRVSDGEEECVVDLVAESVAAIDSPRIVSFQGTRISVDSPHEILVNKLCTLLGRSEIRDLQDVRALLEEGGDLERAVADAPRKDGGFSPLTLAWILRNFAVERLAQKAGLSGQEAAELLSYRDLLADRLATMGAQGHPEPLAS